MTCSTLIVNFEVVNEYRVASLCMQLLPEFLSNQFETLRRCYKHIENMHMTFCRQKKTEDKIQLFSSPEPKAPGELIV